MSRSQVSCTHQIESREVQIGHMPIVAHYPMYDIVQRFNRIYILLVTNPRLIGELREIGVEREQVVYAICN